MGHQLRFMSKIQEETKQTKGKHDWRKFLELRNDRGHEIESNHKVPERINVGRLVLFSDISSLLRFQTTEDNCCYCCCCLVPALSLTFFMTPGTAAHQAPQPMGFPRQEYWGGVPFPFPGDLSNLEIEPVSPALAGIFFTLNPPGRLQKKL